MWQKNRKKNSMIIAAENEFCESLACDLFLERITHNDSKKIVNISQRKSNMID